MMDGMEALPSIKFNLFFSFNKPKKEMLFLCFGGWWRKDELIGCLALPSTNERFSICWMEWAAGEEKKWNQFHQFHSFKRMEWNGFTFLPLINSSSFGGRPSTLFFLLSWFGFIVKRWVMASGNQTNKREASQFHLSFQLID